MRTDKPDPSKSLDTGATFAGGTASVPGSGNLEQGSAFGRYVILNRLGAGGMGVVYAAYDGELDRKVAIKLLLPSRRGADAQQRLLREARAMARLAHPNVVTVHDAGEVEGRAFIAMEFVNGASLDSWLDEEAHTSSEILAVYLAAGRGLAAAHRAGLIHRDFKPANVLLGDDGRVRVADFGLARSVEISDPDPVAMEAADTMPHQSSTPEAASGDSPSPLGRLTMPDSIVGTPLYMAPEQVLERRAEAASDQFSFCVALFEAFYKTRPFGSGDMMQTARRAIAGEVTQIPSSSGLPPRARKALLKGLGANPQDRFANMDELLHDLAHDPTVIRKRWLAAGLAAAAALAAGALLVNQHNAHEAICGAGPARFASVWNNDRLSTVQTAFASTGATFAESVTQKVAARLDGAAEQWSASYSEACTATRFRGEYSEDVLDRQMACLDQRLLELDKLLTLFADADLDIVEQAVDAVASLPDPQACARAGELVDQTPLPADPELRASIDAVRAMLAEGEALKLTGAYEEAYALSTAADEAASEIDHPPLTAEARQLKGHLEIELGHAEAARTTLQRALEAAEWGGCRRLAATIENEMVWLHGVLLNDEAQALFWSGLEEAGISRLADGDAMRAQMLTHRAATFEYAGRYDEALTLQREAYEIMVRTMGPESLEASYSENQLANAFYSVGEFEEALNHYRQAAQLREQLLGPSHPHLAVALGNIGSTLSHLERSDEALPLLKRALSINEATYGPASPKLATDLNNLAFAQEAQGDLSAALKSHERGLALVREAWGPDHPQTAFAHINRVSILRKLGDFERGLEDAREAGRIIAAAYGEDHPYYAYATNAEGVMLFLMGRPGEAIAPLEQAVGIRAQVTTDPLPVAQTKFSLAKALWISGRDRQRARDLMIEARRAFESEGDRGAEDIELMDDWLEEQGLANIL